MCDIGIVNTHTHLRTRSYYTHTARTATSCLHLFSSRPSSSPFSSLRTSLCLRYPPTVICVAAIRLSMRHLMTVTKQLDAEPTRRVAPGFPQPSASAKEKPWFEELFGVDKKTDKGQWMPLIHTVSLMGCVCVVLMRAAAFVLVGQPSLVRLCPSSSC
jgi:hypothetical protein